MSSADLVYLNGRIVGRSQAAVSPLDRGFLYGDGFFETTRIIGARALLLELHLARLAESCRQTGFARQPEEQELTAAVAHLIEANGVREGYLRITVSRGPYAGRLADFSADGLTTFIEARAMDLPPLESPPPLALVRSAWRRNERSPLVRHKCLSYMANVLSLAEGQSRGADEVYFLNSRDLLTEGAISNLFLVRGGVVLTPDVSCGLLPGITRRVVLELCGRLGVPTAEGTYAESCLAEADEAFCTNSLRGVMGVARLLEPVNKKLDDGAITRRLQQAYAQHARAACGGQGRS